MPHVAQILPDAEEAVVLVEALTCYINDRGNNYDDPKVMTAEGIKADLIVKVRQNAKRAQRG